MDAKVCTLGVAQQQLVEVAKAVSQDARILIMDEPTATLSDSEICLLYTSGKDSVPYVAEYVREMKQAVMEA